MPAGLLRRILYLHFNSFQVFRFKSKYGRDRWRCGRWCSINSTCRCGRVPGLEAQNQRKARFRAGGMAGRRWICRQPAREGLPVKEEHQCHIARPQLGCLDRSYPCIQHHSNRLYSRCHKSGHANIAYASRSSRSPNSHRHGLPTRYSQLDRGPALLCSGRST